jgi:bifunctional enzyme CysN/CysC
MDGKDRQYRADAAGVSHDVHWQELEISRDHHAKVKGQKPAVLWLTGISGAGKSTLGNLIEKRLAALGRHTFLLDGDNIRHGLNRDLGFTDADRIENIRRVSEVVKLLTDAGLIVITAFISPFRSERQIIRQMMAPGEFYEVFVDTPIEHAEARDVKGLYKKARAGLIKNFTGIDSPYERPEQPELRVDTTKMTLKQATDAVVAMLGLSS